MDNENSIKMEECFIKTIRYILIMVIMSLLFTGCNNIKSDEQNFTVAASKTIEEIDDNSSKITFESKIIGKDMDFNIYLPIGYNNEISIRYYI